MPEKLLADLKAWAQEVWPDSGSGRPDALRVRLIASDGSPRLFARFGDGQTDLVGMANPDNPPENRAWFYFASHLRDKGLPVPLVLARDDERGFALMHDLGSESMRKRVLAVGDDEEAVAGIFDPVLGILARLQAHGHEGLDMDVCFDSRRLDAGFLLEREAWYFLREFVEGACHINRKAWPQGLVDEVTRLSRLAGEARPQGLVHRDFQWRNVIWGDKGPGLVDFQGARMGPAQYDLAALLHEAGLSWELKARFMERYIELRRELGEFDAGAFRAGWPFVSLSRIMQALGAFGYLSLKRGLPHLYLYARSHVGVLRGLVKQEAFRPYPALRALAAMLPDDFQPPD
jgi:aminoglycoside/choline kinase family phosphotransferase